MWAKCLWWIMCQVYRKENELATHDTQIKLMNKVVAKDKGIMRGHSSMSLEAWKRLSSPRSQ